MTDIPKTIHDTTETQQRILREVKVQYLSGEITQAEYKQAVSKYEDAEAVADEIETFKRNRFERLQEQFTNDEITDDELEERLERLLESGDEFLQQRSVDDADPDDGRDLLRPLYSLLIAILVVGSIVYLPGWAFILTLPVIVMITMQIIT